jgi:hypothetical protein
MSVVVLGLVIALFLMLKRPIALFVSLAYVITLVLNFATLPLVSGVPRWLNGILIFTVVVWVPLELAPGIALPDLANGIYFLIPITGCILLSILSVVPPQYFEHFTTATLITAVGGALFLVPFLLEVPHLHSPFGAGWGCLDIGCGKGGDPQYLGYTLITYVIAALIGIGSAFIAHTHMRNIPTQPL